MPSLVLLVIVATALGTGCGQAAKAGPGSSSAAQGRVYHVSITVRAPHGFPGARARATEWVDPAGRRFRSVDVLQAGGALHATTLVISTPGLGQTTMMYGPRSKMPRSITTVSYGSGSGPDDATGDEPFPALFALRSYLGLPTARPLVFHVEHADGHTQVVFAYPGLTLARLKAMGLPASVLRRFHAIAQARFVMTILGTISREQADQRGLFAIDPARADQIQRSLEPGVAPTAPSPVYWLGTAWGGLPAKGATSTVTAPRAAKQVGGSSYDTWYGSSPFELGRDSIDVETASLGPASSGFQKIVGKTGTALTLADGTPAVLAFPTRPGRSDTGTSSTTMIVIGSSSFGGTSFPFSRSTLRVPTSIFVFTKHSQITIEVTHRMGYAQVTKLVRSLRAVG